MRKSKKIWTLKKLGKKKKFEGKYEFRADTKRIFVLVGIGFKHKEKLVFNSPEAAIAQGWVFDGQ